MPRRPSSKRYALAIFQLAQERDEIERWQTDLQVLDEALQEREFASFLGMPRIRLTQKMSVIQEALPDLNPLAHSLLGLLVARGVVNTLPSIRENYGNLLDQHQRSGKGKRW